MTFSEDAKIVATGFEEGVIRLWALDAQAGLRGLKASSELVASDFDQRDCHLLSDSKGSEKRDWSRGKGSPESPSGWPFGTRVFRALWRQ
jgi:hypothetical protein